MPTVVHGQFEWHDEKALSNVEKHGVRFEDAVLALGDYFSVSFDDSGDPENIVTLAALPSGRILYVVSTVRGDRIRVVSARYATKPERNLYEQG